jgi:hypothetical protein
MDYAIADPRLIGMVAMNYPNLIHYHLNSELGRTDRDVPSIGAEMHDGLECWRVEHSRVNGAVTRLWIAPSQGYSVVRIETEFTDGAHRIIDSVHCNLVNYDQQGLWFPKGSHYERSIDGEIVEMEECQLIVHHLNLPVEKSTFALAGLGIPAGTPITRIPSDFRGSLVWNGREAVPRSLLSAPGVPAGGWRASLGLASAGLALVAALAVVVYSRRRLRPVQSA